MEGEEEEERNKGNIIWIREGNKKKEREEENISNWFKGLCLHLELSSLFNWRSMQKMFMKQLQVQHTALLSVSTLVTENS